ncbi:MAG: hypothetical protein AAGA05_14190, partial [Pseudomonadota bacterium]
MGETPDHTRLTVIDIDKIIPWARFRGIAFAFRFFAFITIGMFAAALVLSVIEAPIEDALADWSQDFRDGIVAIV